MDAGKQLSNILTNRNVSGMPEKAHRKIHSRKRNFESDDDMERNGLSENDIEKQKNAAKIRSLPMSSKSMVSQLQNKLVSSQEEDVGEDEADLELEQLQSENKKLKEEMAVFFIEKTSMRKRIRRLKKIAKFNDLGELFSKSRELFSETSKLVAQVKEANLLSDVNEEIGSPVYHSNHSESTPQRSDVECEKPTVNVMAPMEKQVTLLGGVKIDQHKLENCSHDDYRKLTSDMLRVFFSVHELANSSLTGTSSKAFKGRPPKPALNKEIVTAICDYVVRNKGVTETVVRHAITIKLNNDARAKRMRRGNPM